MLGLASSMDGVFDITPFARVVQRLEECLERHRQVPDDLMVRDALIKRFSFAYELAYKTLRRYLTYVAPSAPYIEHMEFPELIRTANEFGLLLGTWPTWRSFRQMRGMTMLTYSETIAVSVVDQIPGFLEEALFLRDKLRERLG